MKPTLTSYKRRSTDKKICIILGTLMVTTVAIITMTLIVEAINIKSQQEVIPGQYFSTFNEKSLQKIADGNKGLILDLLDYRRRMLDTVRMSILNFKQRPLQKNQSYIISKSKPLNQTIQCVFSNPTSSIFSCQKDIHIDGLLRALNIFLPSRPVKRFNVYYQNNKNKNDVMLKSLSYNLVLYVNASKITDIIQNSTQNMFIFTKFYEDQYGNYNNGTIAYRLKFSMKNYTVFLQIQDHGTFARRMLTKILYFGQLYALIIVRNQSDIQKLSIFSNYSTLHPELYYTQLLEPGYRENIVTPHQSGNKLFSYSVQFPSHFEIDKQIDKQKINSGNYTIIFYSPCIVHQMKGYILGFIFQLMGKIIRFAVAGFIILGFLLCAITFYVARIIKVYLRNLKNSIRNYLHEPKTKLKILKDLQRHQSEVSFFSQVFKKVYQIVKSIEQMKRKSLKITKKTMKSDKFPLNQIYQPFSDRYDLHQSFQLKQIRHKLQWAAVNSSNKNQ